MIKKSEMMLEWLAEQVTEITQELIDPEFVLQQMHRALMALTSCEADELVANSRKNPLEAWRRLQKRCDPTTGGRKRNLLRTRRCSLLELQAGIERWESYVSRDEKKLKDKFYDEIKLAGLEALVPEGLEKHLTLNSNRLRTFEDARLEIVTYVEEKFGFCVRVPRQVWWELEDTLIQWMLTQSILLHLAKEKGHRVHEMAVSSALKVKISKSLQCSRYSTQRQWQEM